MAEEKVLAALVMDRSDPLGNSEDQTERRALHILNMSSQNPTPWLYFDVEYPTPVIEVYRFYNGLPRPGGTNYYSVQLEYTDSTKNFIARADKL